MDIADDTNFTIEDYRAERLSLIKTSNLQLEELKQANYSLKRTVERQNMTIQDLRAESESLSELESQHTQTVVENRDLKARCKSLQDTVTDLTVAISCTESPDLDLAKPTTSAEPEIHSVLEAGIIDPYFLKMENEIDTLKATVRKLNDNLQETILQKNYSNSECARLTGENQQLNTELGELSAALKTIRENSAQVSEALEESREQVALLKADIDRITSEQETPMAAKGNSLFSEVEVSRQKLLKRYTDLRNVYQSLQVSHVRKCSEMSKLNAEKAAMCHQMASLFSELQLQDTDLLRSLERRVRELEAANGRLTEQVKQPVQIMADLTANELRFITDLVTNTRNEVGALEEELERRSISLLASARRLSTTQQQLSSAKSDLMRTSAQLVLAQQAAQQNNALDVEGAVNGNGVEAMDCASGPATQADASSEDKAGGSKKTADRLPKIRFDSTAGSPDNTPMAKLNRTAPPKKLTHFRVTIPSVASMMQDPPEDSEK